MFGKLFGRKDSKYKQYASDLYETLVLEPPSSGSMEALGPSDLEIDMGQFPRYSEKRLLLLEAMLCTAAVTVYEMPSSEALKAITSKIFDEWKKRGLLVATETEVVTICFKEVEILLESFTKWSRTWLTEFYDNVQTDCPHLSSWGKQCQDEYEAMVNVMTKYKDY